MAQKQIAFRDRPEFQRGRSGEKHVASLLQRRGWYVIASYDFAGDEKDKAPKLMAAANELIIPDLDVSKGGKRLWVEVKTKATATYTRITQRLEHGIPWRHFQHYQEVAKVTGCPVWLAIQEEDTGQTLVASLDTLVGVVRESVSPTMGHMAFFPRATFKELDRA